jgi:hypothetical protein
MFFYFCSCEFNILFTFHHALWILSLMVLVFRGVGLSLIIKYAFLGAFIYVTWV